MSEATTLETLRAKHAQVTEEWKLMAGTVSEKATEVGDVTDQLILAELRHRLPSVPINERKKVFSFMVTDDPAQLGGLLDELNKKDLHVKTIEHTPGTFRLLCE